MGRDRIFKRGDVVVSGFGNIRIFTGEVYSGDSYKCLSCYCTSDAPSGTDMRYARHATDREKRLFFSSLKANGLCYNSKTLAVTIVNNRPVDSLVYATVEWRADGPLPYSVMKKRVRPTLSQVRDLESGLENERRLHISFAKECDRLKVVVKKLESEVREGLDMNDKLSSEVMALQQLNRLMEEELGRQKVACAELGKSNSRYKEELLRLRGRGFWARVFNKTL